MCRYAGWLADSWHSPLTSRQQVRIQSTVGCLQWLQLTVVDFIARIANPYAAAAAAAVATIAASPAFAAKLAELEAVSAAARVAAAAATTSSLLNRLAGGLPVPPSACNITG